MLKGRDSRERFKLGRKKLSGGLGDAVVGWEFLLSQKKAKKAELTMKILNKTKERKTNTW